MRKAVKKWLKLIIVMLAVGMLSSCGGNIGDYFDSAVQELRVRANMNIEQAKRLYNGGLIDKVTYVIM